MLAKSIIESDMFSNMPLDAQMLYVRLNLAADDDGFISNPRSVMRMCGASDDCMKLLVAKKFVLSFEVGDDFVFLIKHWKVHNYLRSDRYKASTFKNLLREVYYDENKAYSMTPGEGKTPCIPIAIPSPDTDGIPMVDQVIDSWDTQVRIGKDRKDKSKDSVGKDIYENADPILPTDKLSEIRKYVKMIQAYEEKGWGTIGVKSLALAKGITLEELNEALQKEAKVSTA